MEAYTSGAHIDWYAAAKAGDPQIVKFLIGQNNKNVDICNGLAAGGSSGVAEMGSLPRMSLGF
jgi:hypothetical protein